MKSFTIIERILSVVVVVFSILEFIAICSNSARIFALFFAVVVVLSLMLLVTAWSER